MLNGAVKGKRYVEMIKQMVAKKSTMHNVRLYCVRVQANHDCWIADWDGDPGRTLVKENAKTFKRMSDAGKLCKEMRAKYPNRNVWVDVF